MNVMAASALEDEAAIALSLFLFSPFKSPRNSAAL